MLPAILTPRFARLDDYAGLWSVAEDRFLSLWKIVSREDLSVHFQQPKVEPVCQVEKMPVAGGTNVAMIRLTGLLMKSQSSWGGTSTIQARREIRMAANDPEVGAILLLIDSPGGTVAGTSDLADEVKAARKVKPVWAHVDDLCASAAYWVASQCEKITANSSTALVGSIGTLQVLYDESAAAEKAGIRALVFKTGSLKGLGTPGAAVTEEQVAHVQQLVDAVQLSFDAAVRSGRGLSAKELTAVRHGGVMPASDAVTAKLLDAVQPLSRTVNQLTQAIKGAGMSNRLSAKGGILSSIKAAEEDEEEEEPVAAEGDEEEDADDEGETLPEEGEEEEGEGDDGETLPEEGDEEDETEEE